MAVDREQLLRPSAITLTASPISLSVRDDAQAFHHPEEPRHLRLHALLSLREMRHEERRALHPAVVLVHRRPRAVPLGLALLPVPLVRRVRAVVGQGPDLMVPRRLDLVRVEVQLVRRCFALVLRDDPAHLAVRTGVQVRVR